MKHTVCKPLLRALALVAIVLLCAAPSFGQAPIQTECEASGFETYTTYEGMIKYLQDIQATSTEVKLFSYGKSTQGRELMCAIVSRPSVTQPWEAMALNKPIVVCAANVHGGERTVREGVLILLRDLATKGTAANKMLDEMIVLVIPSVNPDGFVARTRGNAWGIDLNRDYMKLEHQEIYALTHEIYNNWHPHVVLDGHNGGSRPYNICYQAHNCASADQRITELCDHEIFPLVNKRMEENGYRSFYYSGGNEERWNGAPSYPRVGHNYASYINGIGILAESPGGQPIEEGAKSGLTMYMGVMEFVQKNPEKIMETVTNARLETIMMAAQADQEVMVENELVAQDWLVDYELRDGTQVTDAKLMTKPVVTKSRKRPYAYILPREAVDAVAMLRRQNITVEVLQRATSLEVEAYSVKDINYRSEYDHKGAVIVEVDEVVTMTQNFTVGAYVVPLAQMNGRVAAHLLEPESLDNVVRWNTMDAWLPRPQPVSVAAGQQGQRGQRAAGAVSQQRGAGRGQRTAGAVSQQRGAGRGQRAAGQQRQRGAGGMGQRQQRGQGGGASRAPVIPIYKVMKPIPLPTQILK